MGDELTIREAQRNQPWSLPYAVGVQRASKLCVPHILASHCALHAAKSVGKLAAVFEAMDHPRPGNTRHGPIKPTDAQMETIQSMSADLVTAALRFANLYGFDLSDALEERVEEKNGVGFGDRKAVRNG